MCIFGGGGGKPQVMSAPPVAPAPSRGDEDNQRAVAQSLEDIQRRRGLASTVVTGGLGDSSYGSNVNKPRVTALGQG